MNVVATTEPATSLPTPVDDIAVSPQTVDFATEPMSRPSTLVRVDVPGYEILAELGRGGMGVVYKARHISLRRIVALKMILAGGHARASELDRFRTEAESIARLQHINIVQIHEIGEHGGLPYFSLEFCSGGSLAAKLAGTPLPPHESAALVEQLARAMQAAHDKGVIHRDLKPANVLLAEDGTPKITDFGLAKQLDEAGKTQAGTIMGTPSYMAPEQAGSMNFGRKPKKSARGQARGMHALLRTVRAHRVSMQSALGPACDVYALGAVLYECLTGRPPFRAATVLDTIMQVVTEDPVPPSQLNAEVPPDLQTICLKCLQKEPVKRYETAEALADDLKRFQAGEPIEARPVGSIERTVKWVKRRPGVAGLIAAVVVVAFVGFTGMSGGLSWALVERNHALGQEKKANDQREKAEKLAVDNGLLAAQQKKLAEDNGLLAAQQKKLADANQALFEKANMARQEAEEGREKAEELALRVEFEHYFSKAEERADIALVGMARLLPRAAQRKDQTLANLLRLQLAAWSARAPRLTAIYADEGVAQHAVALSADGKAALSRSVNFGPARLWDTSTGKPIGTSMQKDPWIASPVMFSADRKIALTRDASFTKALLWDTATGKTIGPALAPMEKDTILALALSADGKTALTAIRNTVRVWDTATGNEIGPPLQHTKGGSTIDAVALSGDGKLAMSAGRDMTARLWDVRTGKAFGLVMQHQDVVCAVALSADGSVAMTGSFDKTARFWHAKTFKAASGTPMGPPLQHPNMVQIVALSADGNTALTMTADGWTTDRTARIWDAKTGKQIGPPLQNRSGGGIALSANGGLAFTGDARLWNLANARRIPLPHKGGIFTAVLSADGKTALTATGSLERTTVTWDTATGKPTRATVQHPDLVTEMALTDDGKRALLGNGLNGMRLWDLVTGKPVGPTLKHSSGVTRPALSADGKIAMTLSGDNEAQLSEADTGKPIGPPLPQQGRISPIALSANGKTACTTSGEGKTQIWDVATGKPIGMPLATARDAQFVAISANGKVVLARGYDNTVWLWDSETGKAIAAPLPHKGVEAVALSADGKTVLTGSRDNTARLWNAATGKPIGAPLQHQGTVGVVALSADGNRALTGSHDQTARIWDIATGKPIGPSLQFPSGLRAGVPGMLSADGSVALTVHNDGSAQLWRVPQPLRGDPEQIKLWAQVITGIDLDELGAVQILDADAWQERKQRLQELGGPPVSD